MLYQSHLRDSPRKNSSTAQLALNFSRILSCLDRRVF